MFIPPVALPKELSEFEKQQINKIVIKGSTKQTTYQVMIGIPDVSKKFKWPLFQINVAVTRIGNDFNVVAELKDARKSKTVNIIKESEIPYIEFYRRLEDIINRLFLPPEKFGSSEEKPRPPKIKAEILPQPVPEAKVANLNFRERIMDLKSNVNEAVAKAGAIKKEKKPADAAKDNSGETKNKKADPTKENSSEGDLLAANEGKPATPAAPLPLDVGHSMRVGYYNVNTNSKDNLLDTDSHPKYLLIDYEYASSWVHGSKVYHHLNGRYGKTLNKEEKEFAPYIGGSIMEGYFFDRFGWMPKAGLEMDTISFKNLPEIGKGLKVANNRIFWFTIASVNSIKIFSRGFRFSLGYSKPFKIMSDYKGLDQDPALEGSKINLTFAVLEVFRKYHFEVNYFQSQLEAKSDRTILFDTQGVGFNAFYNF